MTRTRHLPSLLATLCLGASPLLAMPQGRAFLEDPLPYEQAVARHQELMQRKPLRHHFIARELLAQTARPEALQTLLDDYKKGKAFREQAHNHLASLFGEFFCDDPFVADLRKLRLEYPKPLDTWLWVQCLYVEAKRSGEDAVLEVATADKSVHHRAAAIVALSLASSAKVFDAIYAACIDFPKKESDRFLLLGAMSGAVLKNRSKVRSDAARAGMTAYISLLGDEMKLPHLAKIQIARHLQLALDGPGLLVQPEPWLLLLQQGEKKRSSSGNTVTQPRFFGIETEGERLCYVVDMSNSMLQDIAPSVRPQGPVTGPKKKPKGALLDESDLPWHTIRTRFDLAREHLKLSLQRLPEDKHFCVVWFGDGSGTLPSIPGLVRATKANVQKALKDLDAITPEPPAPPKDPFGILKGDTNMHSGLRRAFSLSGKGFVENDAFVDPGPLTEGCDTIFLLSDGSPKVDDWNTLDKDYGEGDVVLDQETGAKAMRTPNIWYPGPYSAGPFLCADVARMNTFRRVRIHGIGIGEADRNLLKALADIGQGQVYMVGNEKK